MILLKSMLFLLNRNEKYYWVTFNSKKVILINKAIPRAAFIFVRSPEAAIREAGIIN